MAGRIDTGRKYAIDTDLTGHQDQKWSLYRVSDDTALFASTDFSDVLEAAHRLGISDDDIDEWRT